MYITSKCIFIYFCRFLNFFKRKFVFVFLGCMNCLERKAVLRTHIYLALISRRRRHVWLLQRAGRYLQKCAPLLSTNVTAEGKECILHVPHVTFWHSFAAVLLIWTTSESSRQTSSSRLLVEHLETRLSLMLFIFLLLQKNQLWHFKCIACPESRGNMKRNVWNVW